MDEKIQEHVFVKIEQFLDTQSQYWYPQLVTRYRRISAYSDFDDMLKREVLYTGYLAEELIMSFIIDFLNNRKRLDLLLSYKSADLDLTLLDQNFLDFLRRRGVISNIQFYPVDHPVMNIDQILEDIARAKARDKKVGRASIHDCFQGILHYGEKLYDVIGYLEGKNLFWLSLIDTEAEIEPGVFVDDLAFREWFTHILTEWLSDFHPLRFRWSQQNELKKPSEHYLLEVFKELSEIGVDASSEDEPEVFRWKVDHFISQSKSFSPLPQQDVETIIQKSGLKIPNDAELLGISPGDSDNPYLMVYYIHTLFDDQFNKNQEKIGEDIPSVYSNPGKIIVEGDLCVFNIDPKNRRVISEYRKWHTIKKP